MPVVAFAVKVPSTKASTTVPLGEFVPLIVTDPHQSAGVSDIANNAPDNPITIETSITKGISFCISTPSQNIFNLTEFAMQIQLFLSNLQCSCCVYIYHIPWTCLIHLAQIIYSPVWNI